MSSRTFVVVALTEVFDHTTGQYHRWPSLIAMVITSRELISWNHGRVGQTAL